MADYKLLLVLSMAATASLVTGRSLSMWERSSNNVLFDEVDTDGDGFVNPSELAEYMEKTSPEIGKNFATIAQDYVASVDSDHPPDGRLNREEFSKLPLM